MFYSLTFSLLVTIFILLAHCSNGFTPNWATAKYTESQQVLYFKSTTEPVSDYAISESEFPNVPTASADAASESDIIESAEAVIPQKEDFVLVTDYIPDIEIDLKYATSDNFTSTVIYDFTDAYLRYGTVEKLRNVQNAVSIDGYSLKIWDSFRPVQAQFKLWEVCPNSTYVANPNNGHSSHSRGNTVDITLVYNDHSEVEMPTGFDDFSPMADRDYSDCPPSAAEHALYLQNLMIEYGFKPYEGEWWHFSDSDSYDVEEFNP